MVGIEFCSTERKIRYGWTVSPWKSRILRAFKFEIKKVLYVRYGTKQEKHDKLWINFAKWTNFEEHPSKG